MSAQSSQIFFVLLLLLPFTLPAQDASGKELQFVVSPYIQDITDSSFCVMWETSVPVKGQVYFALAHPHVLKAELKARAKESVPLVLHKLIIDGLKPDELYFYQVVNVSERGDTLKGPVTQIVIPDYSQSAISFTVVGDNQGDTGCWERLSDLMFKECPRFVIHCGDMVAYGHHKDDWTDEFFKQAQNLMRHIPLYPAIGNHEMNDEKYYHYFNRPYDDAFYTVKKGDLRLIFADTNKDLLQGAERYRKLEETLATCKERWKIVIHHHPPFTSDIASYRSSLMAVADKGDPNIFQLKNLYETYGVDLVLSGHVHGYERSYPVCKNHIDEENGVVYVISAGGGGGFNQESSYQEWFTRRTKKISHFLNVQIQGDVMNVEAIDTSMIVFDSWEIKKPSLERRLNAPLITLSPGYFTDSTRITIENTNSTGSINFRLNDGNYQTAFTKKVSFTCANTATISAVVSEPNNSSREALKTVVKLPLMGRQPAKSAKKIEAAYYEGYFTVLPDFERLKPTRVFTLDSLSLSGIQPRVKDHFAVRFTGEITIPESQVYRFFLESFDGSMLLIDGRLIIGNDGVHYEIFKEGYAALEKGTHHIEVRFFDFERRETLNLKMGKQDGEMVDINHYIRRLF